MWKVSGDSAAQSKQTRRVQQRGQGMTQAPEAALQTRGASGNLVSTVTTEQRLAAHCTEALITSMPRNTVRNRLASVSRERVGDTKGTRKPHALNQDAVLPHRDVLGISHLLPTLLVFQRVLQDTVSPRE